MEKEHNMSEQTMVRAHKLGREFYQENPGLRPTFVDALAHIGFNTICDRDAFVAGYRGEQLTQTGKGT